MDYLFPSSIPLKRVNWDAKNSYEYVQNYKLLQAAFSKNRVQKYIDVDKLIRGKYQDNLEFCQWLKAFHDQQQMHGSMRDDYDPVAAREKGKGGKKVKTTLGKATTSARKSSRRTTPTSTPTERSTVTQTRKASSSNNRPPSATRTSRTQKENTSFAMNKNSATTTNSRSKEADKETLKKNKELTSRNAELELTISEIEKERDFYFEKLRDVEVLLQVHQEKNPPSPNAPSETKESESLIQNVFKVLYATTEEKVTVSDDGELISENQLDKSASNMDISLAMEKVNNVDDEIMNEAEQDVY